LDLAVERVHRGTASKARLTQLQNCAERLICLLSPT
jgi:hypothetical protein